MTNPVIVTPPSRSAREAADQRLSSLAVPGGALGQLGELAVWWSSVAGQAAAPPPHDIRAVIFAGDHGVAHHGVSAYPATVTPAMVRAFAAGQAGASVLARQHGVRLRVVDISVDADLGDLDPAVGAHKLCRGSGAIHLEDAISVDLAHTALEAGADIADTEIAAGAQLLIGGDMGIGNTTVAAALIAATLGLTGTDVAGRGTGVDDAGWHHKSAVIDQALARAGDCLDDPVHTLAALGSADIAATTGFLARAAECGVPVLLDGLISVAAAILADRIAPGAADWWAAGHRSTEPAQSHALEKLSLTPILDIGMRLGEGSGALAAVPLLRSAAALLADVAALDDIV